MQEEHDNEDDEQQGFDECVNDGVDGFFHEHRGIVGDGVIDTFGHLFLQFGHAIAHGLRDGERIGTGKLEHAHADGAFVVKKGAQRVVA